MEYFLCKRTRVNIDISESCVVKELSFRIFHVLQKLSSLNLSKQGWRWHFFNYMDAKL
jgi:hypothetical protein